jgi:hypothetical protein
MAGYAVVHDWSTASKISVSCGLVDSLATSARTQTNLVAVIAPHHAPFRVAEMYQTLADVPGGRIQLFTNVQDAWAWLDAAMAASDNERDRGKP